VESQQQRSRKSLGRLVWWSIVALLGFAIAAGTAALLAPERHGVLTVVYPGSGALFPSDVMAPTFRWEDSSSANRWRIEVECADGGRSIGGETGERHWRPAREQWEESKRRSMDGDATVTIAGMSRKRPEWNLSWAHLEIRTSSDPVVAPIFFRDVPLPGFGQIETIRWRIGDVSSDEPPRTVLENQDTCANCHSFSADGKVMSMNFKRPADHGVHIIADVEEVVTLDLDNEMTWSDHETRSGRPTQGLFGRLSPDGRYIVATVDELFAHKVTLDFNFIQYFAPIQGMLAVYDDVTGQITALPGANDPRFAHANPVWSPDGEWIVYARTDAYEPQRPSIKTVLAHEETEEVFIEGARPVLFDLHKIPFNGGEGGVSQPIPGASENGVSNYFAQWSPDGKWIVFCQAENGMFSMLDSALYIIPAEGGTARRLRCNADGRMNSWHSWSPNSRWLAFSSKALGASTKIWLTHIDEHGNDSVPLVLDTFTGPGHAANLPEFVNTSSDRLMDIVQTEALRTSRQHEARAGKSAFQRLKAQTKRTLKAAYRWSKGHHVLAGAMAGLFGVFGVLVAGRGIAVFRRRG